MVPLYQGWMGWAGPQDQGQQHGADYCGKEGSCNGCGGIVH